MGLGGEFQFQIGETFKRQEVQISNFRLKGMAKTLGDQTIRASLFFGEFS
jgi:hypothetical protein